MNIHTSKESYLETIVAQMVKERDLAQADALEQARLCGMGGERESDLLGKVARLERERDALKQSYNDLAEVADMMIQGAANMLDIARDADRLTTEVKTLRDALQALVDADAPDYIKSSLWDNARAAIKWSDYEPN